MKKSALILASTLFISLAFAACSGGFMDPGYRETQTMDDGFVDPGWRDLVPGGGDYYREEEREQYRKPGKLGSGASYNQAIVKLDEIEIYGINADVFVCPISLGNLRTAIETAGSEGWADISAETIRDINALIDTL